MSGMEEGRPPKGNWDLRAQDQGGKGHTGSRGMQRTKKEIVGYYRGGGGEESPPPLFHFRRTNRPRPPTGKDTDAFLHLHLTYTPKQRERKTGIRDTGRRGRHIPSHPSIHPSRPPQLREAAHPRISSSPLLAPPEAARVRPRRSSSATDVASSRNGPRKRSIPSIPSRAAPRRSTGRQRRRRRRSLLLSPPPFSYPLSVYYPASA